MNQSLLEIRGIEKRFPGVHALKGVSLGVSRGEVHALVGENGAGKSTLMHILAGVQKPDAGEIVLDGRPVKIADEKHAQRLGIGIVFQERSLFGLLSVAENVFAHRLPVNRWGVIDPRRLHAQTRAALARFGLEKIDPRAPVEQLSPSAKQMVEIAKALALDAKLMIFDEPTAALTEVETQALFRIIAQLKSQGVGVIYISHRLREIFEIADRVTVLRDGEIRGTLKVIETSVDDLVTRMVGREIQSRADEPGFADKGRIALEVRGLSNSRLTADVRARLRDISFKVHAGEIVGFAGLAGAGRTELALAIFGASPRDSGAILVDGKPINARSPQDAIAAGIGYVSEDRKEAGLFLEMSVAENIAATRLGYFGPWWMDTGRLNAVARDYLYRLRIAAPDVKKIVRQLSGGNQQKVALSKWLLRDPKVLIMDEPTRGIDVGAKAEVHDLLRELARKGKAVILISSDLAEVLAVADRILVMREGRISGELSRHEATEERIMRYASLEV
jgi:ABC-type sugar transport system ATPase subunit